MTHRIIRPAARRSFNSLPQSKTTTPVVPLFRQHTPRQRSSDMPQIELHPIASQPNHIADLAVQGLLRRRLQAVYLYTVMPSATRNGKIDTHVCSCMILAYIYTCVHPRTFDSISGMNCSHYSLPDEALGRRCTHVYIYIYANR